MGKIKTIGILTSGGDAPGMNAAIRAVTRAGICNGFNIKGIYRGYDGLIKGEVKTFTTEDVSGIITRGGTILKTARSTEFMTPEGRKKAYETCLKEEIDALVVIGGNGSLTGAWNFGVEFDFPVIGLPLLDPPDTNPCPLGKLFISQGLVIMGPYLVIRGQSLTSLGISMLLPIGLIPEAPIFISDLWIHYATGSYDKLPHGFIIK